MIKFKLERYLRKHDIIQAELARMTKIRPATISAYCAGRVQRFNKIDLNKICRVLNCQITDIIEYVPNKKD